MRPILNPLGGNSTTQGGLLGSMVSFGSPGWMRSEDDEVIHYFRAGGSSGMACGVVLLSSSRVSKPVNMESDSVCQECVKTLP